ncbi:MAG: DNA polymerase I [bacterium]
MPSQEKLFLVDGTALAYRGYFAFIKNPLINSKGENTSAPYAFTNSLLKLIREYEPSHIAVVFDAPGRTFRHERFEEYKATREKMPEDLRQSMPRVHQVVEVMSIPILEVPGYEADDVLGTLARRGSREGMEVWLITGDKDLMQCLDENVRMLKPGRRGDDWTPLDAGDVRERWGVDPPRIIDILGLMGDSSDNIPGVPQVGEKRARDLVREYGSVEEVLAHSGEVSQKRVRENLIEYADQARLSRELVTIDTEVPVEVPVEDLLFRGFDTTSMVEIFSELEFTSLVRDLLEESDEGGVGRDADYILADSEEEVERALEACREAEIVSVDLETTSLDPHEARVVGVSLAAWAGRAWYLPLRHERGSNLPAERTLEMLRELLEDPERPKAGHNIKYDTLVLRSEDIRMEGIGFDTMVASYLLNPSRRQHSLDSLALEYLQHQMIPISSLIGSGKDQVSFADVLTEDAWEYACEDAEVTLRLQQMMAPKLEALALRPLFDEIEMPLVPVLVEMEANGVLVDREQLADMGSEFEAELEALEKEIHELAGEEFNVNSPQQLQEILFEKMGLPRGRRTKTGWSTDSEVLEGLVAEHPVAQKILDYRGTSKLKSTYIDALPRLIEPGTGRIHTSFNQTVATTGRLSSSEPNLQNIPVRTEAGRRIRKAFIAPEGRVLLSADYSQIELRIMAHISRDERLLEAFRQGTDIHTSTAAAIFDVDPDRVSDTQRRQAKIVNFGVMYGMGSVSLGKQLGIPSSEAKEFIENYFQRFSGVARYIEETKASARQNGYVTTLLNRRRYMPELESRAPQVRSFAERTAVNTPIQGSAADLIKKAMIEIQAWIWEEGMPADMIIQVHDELVFEVDGDAVEEVQQQVVGMMEGALELEVPIVVDSAWGRNWAEAH